MKCGGFAALAARRGLRAMRRAVAEANGLNAPSGLLRLIRREAGASSGLCSHKTSVISLFPSVVAPTVKPKVGLHISVPEWCRSLKL